MQCYYPQIVGCLDNEKLKAHKFVVINLHLYIPSQNYKHIDCSIRVYHTNDLCTLTNKEITES